MNFTEVIINTFKIQPFKISILIFVFISIFLIRKNLAKIIVGIIYKTIKKLRPNIDKQIIKIIELPLQLLIVVVTFWAISIFLPITGNLKVVLNSGVRSFVAIAIFWILYNMSDNIHMVLEEITEKTSFNVDEMILHFFGNISKIIIVVGLIVILLQEWHYNVGSILTGLGLGGIAFAFAAKNTIENFFGSIVIVLEKPFIIGDTILVSQVEGTVETIGFRSTNVRLIDQSVVTIPNSIMNTSVIINKTRISKRRISVRFTLDYNTPNEKINEAVLKINDSLLNREDLCLQDVNVYVDNLTQNGVEVVANSFTEVVAWNEYIKIKQQIYLETINALKSIDVLITYPSTNVYLKEK